ncbi:MAG: hypothetical protein L0220_16965, partial [Acidobacteria bacterium]|nr:hypothetical protein [Acidobacteriota bacterium]
MAKGEEIPKTTPTEVENLIEQIRATNLDPSAKEKIERLLRTILILVELLQRKKTSIKRLREMLFGKSTEKHQKKKADGEQKAPPEGNGSSDEEKPGLSKSQTESDQTPKVEPPRSENKEKLSQKGHGHRAASDYPGAKVVKCWHAFLKVGDPCPGLCGGRLYDTKKPASLLQFTGVPLIQATNYEREVFRCAKCQERYEASLPEGIADERYTPGCDATFALMRYGAGLP